VQRIKGVWRAMWPRRMAWRRRIFCYFNLWNRIKREWGTSIYLNCWLITLDLSSLFIYSI